MVGGAYLLRPSGDLKGWLPGAAVKSKDDGTVYAMIQTKYLGKDLFGEEKQALLTQKEGWQEVDGKASTTFPSGEGWEWKVYKKDIKAGDVILQLDKLKWDDMTPVLFVFK